MELSSVRELKQSLKAMLREDLAATTTYNTLGVPAQPPTMVGAPRLLALGVAASRGRSGYRLAVRVQNRALQSSPEVEMIRRQARDEVDVRYIGTVGKRSWSQQRHRPLQIGTSIGHFKVTAGTLDTLYFRA